MLFNGTYYLKTRCLTDKQRLMKNSWNRRPLSFTTRFSIIPFYRRDELYRVADEETLKSLKQMIFLGIFSFELFIQFTLENIF